jgi:hypothetical protein
VHATSLRMDLSGTDSDSEVKPSRVTWVGVDTVERFLQYQADTCT